MLELEVGAVDLFDERTEEFIEGEAYRFSIEHSLVSLSKWESFFKKPFLSTEKDDDQTLWYIKAMTVTPGIPDNVYSRLPQREIDKVNEYINDTMTATWFAEVPQKKGRPEVITAELIYYWMIALNIPFECQHWHLNRLLTLVKVCNFKNAPEKKMDPKEAAQQRRLINEQRRAKYGTKG